MSLLSLDQARDRILAAISRLPVESLAFEKAAGRVLATDIVSDDDLPPWRNSAMDGFALRVADVVAATPDQPAALKVVGDLPAGQAPTVPVLDGQAIRIMTGAPIPDGADGVVMVEKTRTEGHFVHVETSVRPGENIRSAGENIARGETALAAGDRLRAAEVGLLASLGVTRVDVYRKPKVAVISSGDELVPPGETPGPGQIRDSNRFALCAHIEALGFEAVDFGNAPDRFEAIEALFRKAAGSCDVLVSTGGVSVGDFDLTKKVLAGLGQVDFWRVAIRPGKPLAFGFIDDRPVFGLPGNPVSSLVVLDQLVRPALRKMAGHARLFRDMYKARLEEPLRTAPGRTEFVRAIVHYEGGGFVARSTGPQGSNILKSLKLANAFIIVPADAGELPAGAIVDCELFAEEL